MSIRTWLGNDYADVVECLKVFRHDGFLGALRQKAGLVRSFFIRGEPIRSSFVSALIGMFLAFGMASTASATTTLLVQGTFANFSDQLTLNFAPHVSVAETKFRTYQYSGGSASPGINFGGGGMDSVIDLYGPSGFIAGNDDITGSRDSELRTSGFAGAAGATVISPLGTGDHNLILRNFSSGTLGNGTFVLNAMSQSGITFLFDYGFSINGLAGTAGVSISRMVIGQDSSSIAPPKLNSDSPAESLTANHLQFFRNYEWNISDGTVTTEFLFDGAINEAWGGGGTGQTNITGGTLYANRQFWGDDFNHTSIINHSGGSNSNSALISIGNFTGSNTTYNLSGSGVVTTDFLYVGSGNSSGTGTAQFLQSGGTVHADVANVGSNATIAEISLYRLTGGVATLDSLSIGRGGVFELSGGTLSTASANSINAFGGRFDWFSGTLKLNSFTLDSSAGVLGPTLTLGPAQTLEVLGTTTNNTVLTLAGGRLITETVTGPGALVLDSGELRITGAAGLDIAAASPLGANVILESGMFLNVSAGMKVTAGSSLMVQDGGQVSAFSVINQPGGIIQLGGSSARLHATSLSNSGLIRGDGTITAVLSNQMGGEVRANAGTALLFQGAAGTNQGRISLQGGTFETTSALTNDVSGQILGRGTLIVGGAGLTNNGHVTFSSGITDVYGDVDNATGTSVRGITISGRADVTFWDDFTNSAGSLVKVSDGSSATFFASYAGAGISGTGDKYFESDISPGFSPGAISFDGKVSLGSTAMLNIELGGTNRGREYDAVLASGDLTLGGTLAVSLIDVGLGRFEPEAGDSFDILDWDTLSGTFDTLQLPPLAGLVWNTSKLYATGVLSVVAPGLDGDYNVDGTIDAADYVVWRKGVVASTPTNYNLWRSNFGQPAGSGADASAHATVPEPASLVVCVSSFWAISLLVLQTPWRDRRHSPHRARSIV